MQQRDGVRLQSQRLDRESTPKVFAADWAAEWACTGRVSGTLILCTGRASGTLILCTGGASGTHSGTNSGPNSGP